MDDIYSFLCSVLGLCLGFVLMLMIGFVFVFVFVFGM